MKRLAVLGLAAVLYGCGSTPVRQPAPVSGSATAHASAQEHSYAAPPVSDAGREIVMYAMGLIDVGYQFGGKNPEAGLDCSGMVTFIYRNAVNMDLRGSAADIAKRGRPIAKSELQVGDLVFFNTRNKPFSHVGIYIGEGKFIHAPSTNGRIRIENLSTKYFAARYEAARTLLAAN